MLVDEEAALAQARAADGPLKGMPFAVKDIFDVRGWPTTASSKALSGNVAVDDASVIATLRAAGAVFLGKTNTHEFAFGYVTSPTCNPWDTGRIPGGSSGGNGAALAALQCLGAIGSDTGGSIRVPAALCGISGLKTRRGALPLDGVVPLSPTLDTVGPMARSVADLRLLWEVLTGAQGPDVAYPPMLGVVPDAALPDMEPGVMKAYAEALEVLSGLAPLKEAPIPAFEDFDFPRASIILPEVLAAHTERGWWPSRADAYTEETRAYLEFTETFLNDEMIAAGRQEAERLTARFDAALDDFAVLVTPAAPCVAPTHEEAAETEGEGPRRPIAMKLGRIPSPVNMCGAAALAIPCGYADGLPVGIQLIARSEDLLLKIGEAFQSETGWHNDVSPGARL